MGDDIDPARPFEGIGYDVVAEVALGVLVGSAAGGFESGLAAALGGALVPVVSRALSLAEREYTAGRGRAAVMWAHAAEAADRPVGELIDCAESHPDRLHLANTAASGAATARHPAWIVALGRDLASGLIADSLSDVACQQEILDAMSAVGRPHVAILASMTTGNGAAAEGHTMSSTEILNNLPSFEVPFWRLIATLEREGLVISNLVVSQSGPGTVRAAAGDGAWTPTDFGLAVLAKLRAAGLSDL